MAHVRSNYSSSLSLLLLLLSFYKVRIGTSYNNNIIITNISTRAAAGESERRYRVLRARALST